MRLSDLSGKEVINLSDGSRLGLIEQCELIFDYKSGCIDTILVPNRNSMFSFFNESRPITIPWQAIKRIGDEVIIVDLHHNDKRYHHLCYDRKESTY